MVLHLTQILSKAGMGIIRISAIQARLEQGEGKQHGTHDHTRMQSFQGYVWTEDLWRVAPCSKAMGALAWAARQWGVYFSYHRR